MFKFHILCTISKYNAKYLLGFVSDGHGHNESLDFSMISEDES